MKYALIALILMGETAMSQDAVIESKGANLTGAPMPGQKYSYDGLPVTNSVAYTMSQGNSNIVSPFSENPTFKPFNTKLLKAAILRAADAIKSHPDKQVWAVEMLDGEIALFVGDYGNVNASVTLGAIKDTNAAKRDPAYVNGLMEDHNEVARSRGLPEPYPQAKQVKVSTQTWWQRLTQ